MATLLAGPRTPAAAQTLHFGFDPRGFSTRAHRRHGDAERVERPAGALRALPGWIAGHRRSLVTLLPAGLETTARIVLREPCRAFVLRAAGRRPERTFRGGIVLVPRGGRVVATPRTA